MAVEAKRFRQRAKPKRFKVTDVQVRHLGAWLIAWTVLAGTAFGQFKQADSKGCPLGQSKTQRWQAGVIVTAASGPCQGIEATVPVPVDWPEQQVTIAEEDVSSSAKVSYRMVEGTVKQMVVRIARLRAGEEARAVVTVEVTKSAQLEPKDTSIYRLPEERKLPRELRAYLGPSPYIDCRHREIRALAKQIGVDAAMPWQRVEAIYDWVREHVEYQEGALKGAVAALNDKTGDCEDMSSLFIAICRAGEIPARTVWIPGHCYAEFYLQDKEGGGHWFPCQLAGTRAFGAMPDFRPILQKGDNFRAPHDRRQRKRYLAEHLSGKGGRPKVRFIRQLVP